MFKLEKVTEFTQIIKPNDTFYNFRYCRAKIECDFILVTINFNMIIVLCNLHCNVHSPETLIDCPEYVSSLTCVFVKIYLGSILQCNLYEIIFACAPVSHLNVTSMSIIFIFSYQSLFEKQE